MRSRRQERKLASRLGKGAGQLVADASTKRTSFAIIRHAQAANQIKLLERYGGIETNMITPQILMLFLGRLDQPLSYRTCKSTMARQMAEGALTK
ncbi:hypothetical protein [Roseicyclus sp.]|uniref:hypothetical protein n=1 Tax=Roseicyclus sp. TaxID=1914329 RepID=UPI003F695108